MMLNWSKIKEKSGWKVMIAVFSGLLLIIGGWFVTGQVVIWWEPLAAIGLFLLVFFAVYKLVWKL
jgi:hypothetical protein